MIGLFIQLLNTLQALGAKDLTKRLPSPVLCQPGSGMNKIFSFLTRTLCSARAITSWRGVAVLFGLAISDWVSAIRECGPSGA